MSGKIVWFDTSTLIDIESGALKGGLEEVARMQKDGFKMLLPKHVETEFLFSKAGAENLAKREAFLRRFGFEVDNLASQVPIAQVRAWTDQATAAGLGHGDAKMVAHVRASAQIRAVRNPVLLTGNTKDIAKMRLRGVNALKFEPVAFRPKMHVAVHGDAGVRRAARCSGPD
jgi:predicted nucleic acid-binding protein